MFVLLLFVVGVFLIGLECDGGVEVFVVVFLFGVVFWGLGLEVCVMNFFVRWGKWCGMSVIGVVGKLFGNLR